MTNEQEDRPMTHAQKVLQHEVQACDDPVCSCEAEPRWVFFQEEEDQGTGTPSEWDVLRRPPQDEL